jgi:hypothetical protein
MNKKLSLDALVVETFSPENDGTVAAEFIGKPSRYYTDCGSCGIACTSVDPC